MFLCNNNVYFIVSFCEVVEAFGDNEYNPMWTISIKRKFTRKSSVLVVVLWSLCISVVLTGIDFDSIWP